MIDIYYEWGYTDSMCRKNRIIIALCMAVMTSSLVMTGCAYHWGVGERRIPGGYRQVVVPVFVNRTKEVGAEVYFTNAMIYEVERAGVGQIMEKGRAEVTIEGVIESIEYRPESLVNSNDLATLPTGAILATNFRMLVKAHVKVRRNSDEKILWTGAFTGEKLYPAAQVAVRGVNTVNPLYNQSIQKQNLVLVAKDMMSEAYERMTENF